MVGFAPAWCCCSGSPHTLRCLALSSPRSGARNLQRKNFGQWRKGSAGPGLLLGLRGRRARCSCGRAPHDAASSRAVLTGSTTHQIRVYPVRRARTSPEGAVLTAPPALTTTRLLSTTPAHVQHARQAATQKKMARMYVHCVLRARMGLARGSQTTCQRVPPVPPGPSVTRWGREMYRKAAPHSVRWESSEINWAARRRTRHALILAWRGSTV